MKKNAQKTKWLPDMLTALGGPGNEHDCLLVLRSNGLILPTLDGVATKAIQSMCNMNKSQMKQLQSSPRAENGRRKRMHFVGRTMPNHHEYLWDFVTQ
jgi:hypothetical protein